MRACACTPKDENELAVARSLRLSKGRAVIINRLEQHRLAIFRRMGKVSDAKEEGMFCSVCGTQAEDTAQRCPNGHELRPATTVQAAAQQPQVIMVRSGKNAGLAAVMSAVWCGLGQIYNGQIGKGIGMMILYFISAILIIVAIGFITTPIVWIWGMVDAYKTAERLNREAGIPS